MIYVYELSRDRQEALPQTFNQRRSWYRSLPVAAQLQCFECDE
jgi:hypothetical protein